MPAKRRPERAIALVIALNGARDLGLAVAPTLERALGRWLTPVLTLGWVGKSGSLSAVGEVDEVDEVDEGMTQQRGSKVLGVQIESMGRKLRVKVEKHKSSGKCWSAWGRWLPHSKVGHRLGTTSICLGSWGVI